MRRWRWSAAPLAIVALGGLAAVPAGLPVSAAASSQSVSAATALGGTPVLSVRRLPAWLETTAAGQHLDAALGRLAGPSVLGGGHPDGCVVVTQGSQVLFSANATAPFIPASNLKLLTATAVLDKLGPSARLVTRVLGDRKPEGGVIYGNLYLVGGGDPLLRTSAYAASLYPPQPLYTSLDQLALDVRHAGVTKVTGLVVGDDSRYDAQRTVATWKPVYSTEGDVGPLSALDVDDGFVPKPPPPAPGSKAAATESSTAGAFAYAAASNPPATAAKAFEGLLEQDGVEVVQGSTSGVAPQGAPLITSIASAPLGDEIDAMLTVSDDTAAELFTKELGYEESKSGSTAAGTADVRADLAADGLPVSQLVNVDGSGLDRDDRASCDLISATLRRDGTTGVIADGLPIAGKTGTLAKRMLGTPAEGRLHAKTGTLDDVVALSVFVTPISASAPVAELRLPVIFSIILNGLPEYEAENLADGIGIALASYPKVPPLSAIEPSG